MLTYFIFKKRRWENCTVLVLEREEVHKGEEVEDVHCKEVEDVHGDEVKDIHGEEIKDVHDDEVKDIHGEEIEDVHVKKVTKVRKSACKEVYVFHAFYGKLHGRFHRCEEVDQPENADQCGSKSGLSFDVKTVETITVHSFPIFICSKFRYFIQIF